MAVDYLYSGYEYISIGKSDTFVLSFGVPSGWMNDKIIESVTFGYGSITGSYNIGWGPTFYGDLGEYRIQLYTNSNQTCTIYNMYLTVQYRTKNARSTTTLARASWDFGSNVSGTISMQDTNNRHRVEVWTTKNTQTTNSKYYYKVDLAKGVSSFSISVGIDACQVVPNSITSSGVIRITTYDSSGSSLGTEDKSVTFNVPPSVVPTATLAVQSYDNAFKGKPIANRSKANLKCTAQGVRGSSIRTYNFGAGNQTTNTYKTGVLNTTSKYTVIVVDSRGRSCTAAITITAYNYTPPGIASFTVYRSDSNGTKNGSTGTSATANIAWRHTETINGVQNSLTPKLEYKIGNSNWQNVNTTITNGANITFATDELAQNATCDVRLTLTDDAGSVTTGTQNIPTASLFMQWDKSGNTFSFGGFPPNTVSKAIYLSDQWSLYTRGRNLADNSHHRVYGKGNAITNWHNTGITTQFVSPYSNDVMAAKPSEHGNLLSMANGTQVSQLWFTQAYGYVYHRQGNATGYNNNINYIGDDASCWVRLLDENAISTQLINQNGTVASSSVAYGLNQKIDGLVSFVTGNGGYGIKFSNGTLICYKSIDVETTGWSWWGGDSSWVCASAAFSLGNWAMQFYSLNSVSISSMPMTNSSNKAYNTWVMFANQSAGNLSCGSAQLLRSGNVLPDTNVKARISVVGFGRWKE